MEQIDRVVQQLRVRPYYLYLYLDSLSTRDPYSTADYADTQVSPYMLCSQACEMTIYSMQVELYAEYAPRRLIDFLRASNYYNLEKVRSRPSVSAVVYNGGYAGI